ncbi:Reverse transcriptase domain-containing protein [Vibrio chagasii]|nr:Reverse transcriptase domain-containing protein [Vibrio chagasii]CAH6887855.1 Reverse transcriptase domain-containing protein [Vibrio chagasii]CAH6901897.1 Reverse transcriptase domain-containing protein [Vibrio chagasii]CAH7203032.1 Reverse transcriptase domain-containing protein [Vibrio chagasii]CAH7222764.1 Reverse transcriptase domain-containing protein [Vibrio chagasii]
MKNKTIHKENYFRALITDTIPFDLPIIFTNEGFYDNILNEDDNYCLKLISELIKEEKKPTNPIDYSISKNADSVRKLSLPHPSIQYRMCRFYEEYADLICYYTSLSNVSIRAPSKLSSTYYRGADYLESKYKGDNVEREETDFSHKHSVSFFKYRGYNRIYKFFSSGKYYSLEKKFPTFWCMDVSKCFESIYTHSMAWATKSKDIIKSNRNFDIDALFGQKLDTLMQKSNKNETNGIIVGPEFSRIFAEILLQKVDLESIRKLDLNGIVYGRDYEVCRYIDDIFIFASNEYIASSVFSRVSDELRKYNLHVNESKTKKYTRPFITSKSRTINKMNDEINKLSELLFKYVGVDVELANVYSHYNVSNRFIDRIKSICIDTDSTYEDISNYIISSLEQRVRKLIFFYEVSEDGGDVNYVCVDIEEQSKLYRIFLVFIDIIFHLYTISHSVTSSYVVSRCSLIIVNFLDSIGSDYSSSIKEALFNHIYDFSKIFINRGRDQYLPLELINLILITSEFGYEYQFSESYLEENFFDENDEITYFNAISLLYYIKKYPRYRSVYKKLVKTVSKQIQNSESFLENSSDLHLALDMMSCPYVESQTRVKWLRKVNTLHTLGIKKDDLPKVISHIEANPWFVNWKEINLFNLLEKKLLKSNY